MTPEMWIEVIKVVGLVFGGLAGGASVELIKGKSVKEKINAEIEKILAERDELRAKELSQLQEIWKAEFDRLTARIDELEAEKKGQDLTIEEITAENAKLKEALEAQGRDLEAKDKTIKRLGTRIGELEEIMRKHGIDPNGGSNDKT